MATSSLTVLRERWTFTADLLTVLRDGERVGETGVCTDPECRCEGSWIVWGEPVPREYYLQPTT